MASTRGVTRRHLVAAGTHGVALGATAPSRPPANNAGQPLVIVAAIDPCDARPAFLTGSATGIILDPSPKPPGRTTVAVSALPAGARVEITVTALA